MLPPAPRHGYALSTARPRNNARCRSVITHPVNALFAGDADAATPSAPATVLLTTLTDTNMSLDSLLVHVPRGVGGLGARIVSSIVDGHPRVFTMAQPGRKATAVRAALCRLLDADPNASGVSGRLQCAAEQRVYAAATRRSPVTRVPIELLLRELSEGKALSKTGRFFPPASSRIPFTSDNACISWVSLLFKRKLSAQWEPPTAAYVSGLYQRGQQQGYHRWYDDAHALVLSACCGDEDRDARCSCLLAAFSPLYCAAGSWLWFVYELVVVD